MSKKDFIVEAVGLIIEGVFLFVAIVLSAWL